MFFAYFSLKHIMTYNAWVYKKEREELPNNVSQTSCFCYASDTPYRYGFYELHIDVLWLTSFSGKMIIYVFLLGFFSHSRQKEW